jgi:glycosyltransferase involved in cell wall biosynthesis
MVYIEPAPYVVGLVEAIRPAWEGAVDVAFIHDALTQPWDYRCGNHGDTVLPPGHLQAVRTIRHLLASNAYGLLHLAGWGHPVLLGALAVGSWWGLPVTIETDTPLPHSVPLWKRWIKAVSYRLMFRLPAVFLPAGSRQAAYLRAYGVENARIRIVRMTVDVAKIMTYAGHMQSPSKADFWKRYRVPSDHVKILYIGRLEPYKGPQDLVEAFQRLAKEMGGISLLIAGDGSLRSWVEQRAKPPIHYLGRLSGEQVWEACASSDVLVLPSHSESWGLVVNEAMAAGLPVIATDRAGCVDDLVRDGITGLVVPADSPTQLFAAIKRLAADADARRRMGAEAKHLIADWTLENSAKRTVDAWRMALE